MVCVNFISWIDDHHGVGATVARGVTHQAVRVDGRRGAADAIDDGRLEAWPVSDAAKSSKSKGEQLIEPIGPKI